MNKKSLILLNKEFGCDNFPEEKHKKINILYLNTRSFILEKEAQIKAALDSGFGLIIVGPNSSDFIGKELTQFIKVNTGDFEHATNVKILRKVEIISKGLSVGLTKKLN